MAKEIELVLTCEACPEQYDAFLDGKQVGYLRLRWSHFRVDCPDVGGETVYEADIGDSGFDGCFKDDDQRKQQLDTAKAAIMEWVKKELL